MNGHSILEDLINKHRCHTKTPQDFSSVPAKSSVSIREFSVGLKSMINQLQKRIPVKTEKILNAVIYKRTSQQRRQCFWRDVSALNSVLRKYQSNNLLEQLNTVYNKIEKFNSFFYNLTPEMMLHIGASFLAQLFYLDRMNKLILNITNKLFGYIQINHWEKLSIFIIGICADIFYLIPEQTRKVCDTYSSVAHHFKELDPSFPNTIHDIDFVSQLLHSGSINSLPDTNRILSMLNLSNEDLETANIGENIRRIREEVLESQASEAVDIGTAVVREELEENPRNPLKRKLSSVDSAIGSDMNITSDSIASNEVFSPGSLKKRQKNRKKGKKLQ